MSNYQIVIVAGNLGDDPTLKTLPKGDQLCEFRLACNEKWATGEHVEWFRVQVWGKQAEPCSKYLSKGRQALVEGTLRTRKWQDKDGNDRYTTELRANRVTFLGSKDGGEKKGRKREEEDPGFGDDDESSIPF